MYIVICTFMLMYILYKVDKLVLGKQSFINVPWHFTSQPHCQLNISIHLPDYVFQQPKLPFIVSAECVQK